MRGEWGMDGSGVGVVRVIEQSLDVFHCAAWIIGIGPEEHIDQAHHLAEQHTLKQGHNIRS